MKANKSTLKSHNPKKLLKHGFKNPQKIAKSIMLLKPIEIAMIGLVILMGASGLIIYQKHEQKVHQQLNVAPASNQSSSNNNCLLSNSGCSDSQNSSKSTQPAQTTTQSTASTTTKPKSSTPTTSYPTVIDGMVWASPTCHYAPGYGEAYDRNMLVQGMQTQQSGTASAVSNTINQYNEYGLMTSQQALNTVNTDVTAFNNFVSTTYSQYVSEVNSIGCATTIDTTNIPQVPACTDLSGTVCDDSIWAISIPSLE
jgi:cytoskeletal protein RodZ